MVSFSVSSLCPVSLVPGYQLIAALQIRVGNRRNQSNVSPLQHSLVILAFEGVILERIQRKKRDFLHLLQLGILAAFLTKKRIIE